MRAAASEGAGSRLMADHVPRICDFGLAKLLDQESHETCTGVPIGSPTYMAPEQATGRLRDHGPATDVYALGVILYEMLTGRPPLKGETDLETLRIVADQDPIPPRGLRPGVPRDLNTICQKCLQKRPRDRYQSAAALAEDLERFLAGKSVQARPIRLWQHAGKWARRRPAQSALAGVSSVAIALVLGVVLWYGAWLKKHEQNLTETVARVERDVQTIERTAPRRPHRACAGRGARAIRARYGMATQVKLVHDTFVAGDVVLAARMLESLGPARDFSERPGFAWGYLRQLFKPKLIRLGGADHADPWPVVKLAISPDSRLLATGKADGRVVVWDLNERRIRWTLVSHAPGPGAEVYSLAFSRDGRFLASGSTNPVVKLWDTKTGRELGVFSGEPKELALQFAQICDLRFTENSDRLVVLRKARHRAGSVSCSGACRSRAASLNTSHP